MPDPIYLDNHSTTRLDARVAEALAPYLAERYGHPASPSHAYGWDAEKALATARAQVAGLIGAEAREIVFTSGGTEADNLAVKGVAEAMQTKGRHVVTTAIENRAVLDSCAWLESRGWAVTRVAPDGSGRVDPETIARALRPETVLVSIQLANHEVGTIQPIAEIGQLVAERGVWLHSDATQAAPWLDIDVVRDGIHLLSLAADTMYGPKGAGALYVRRRKPRVRVAPQMHGGGHERGLRAGTANVAGLVGFGMAATLCSEERSSDAKRVASLRDKLEAGVCDALPGVRRLGHPAQRLPNNANLTFDGVEGESLLLGLPDVALATGSACASGDATPSHVLPALGLDVAQAATSVRFGLGRFTTDTEINRTIESVIQVVHRTRSI